MGFEYGICASEDDIGIGKLSARKISDRVILNRDFGSFGGEFLATYCQIDNNFGMGNSESRRYSQTINDFYESSNTRLNIDIFSDFKIGIHNYAKEDNYEGCLQIAGILEEMGQTFEEQNLTPKNTDLLMQYIRELHQAV